MEETKKSAAQAAANKTTSMKKAAKDTVKKAEEAVIPAAKAVKEAASPAAKAVKEETEKAAAKAKKAVKTETAKAKTAVEKTVKAVEKKAPAKKAESVSIQLQFSGKSYTTEELVAIAKDVWKYDLKQKESDFKSVELYVKPEENQAYYVINGKHTGSFFI